MKRLTKTQIIDETVAFYSEDPKGRRALDGDECQYIAPNGCRCAVGRCMTVKGAEKAQRIQDSRETGVRASEIEELDDLLRARYRGHDRWFWNALQSLHDRGEHWNGELSPSGHRTSARLRADWK